MAHYLLVTLWYSFLFYLVFIKIDIIGQMWALTNFN